MSVLRVRVNNAALQAFIASPQGPLAQDLLRRGNRLVLLARKQIRPGHVHAGQMGTRAAGRAPMNLRDSIHARLDIRNGKPVCIVGSETVPHALLHHEGTRPHIIQPRNAQVLRFYSNQAGGIVYAKQVRHPGSAPNRYLTDNLPAVLR